MPLQSSLWDINCATCAVAIMLTPKRASSVVKVENGKKRIQQLESKMTYSCQEILRTQCAIVALRNGVGREHKTKRILYKLRQEHLHNERKYLKSAETGISRFVAGSFHG